MTVLARVTPTVVVLRTRCPGGVHVEPWKRCRAVMCGVTAPKLQTAQALEARFTTAQMCRPGRGEVKAVDVEGY